MGKDKLRKKGVCRIIYLIMIALYIALCSSPEDEGLALTPPMGWNSWNAFQADINENKIKQISDIMVSSGMRDAGYKYLVLDDGWMAPERNADGHWSSFFF